MSTSNDNRSSSIESTSTVEDTWESCESVVVVRWRTKVRVDLRGDLGNKSLLVASLKTSLAYLQYQECSCFTSELSIGTTVRYASLLHQGGRPVVKIYLSFCTLSLTP